MSNKSHKRGTRLDYALSKKNMIYKWLMQGLTLADVAEKLGVSRSWFFSALKSCPDLNAVKEEAFADRRERINNTLYSLAIGNYTSKIKHTNKTRTIDKVGDKDAVSRVQSCTKEDIYEHVGDPNIKALSLIVHQMEMQDCIGSNAINEINDTLNLPEDFVYADVSEDDTEA